MVEVNFQQDSQDKDGAANQEMDAEVELGCDGSPDADKGVLE